MPRYETDPTSVTGVIAILDKGEYELLIGEPKAFEKPNKAGNLSVGVRYPITVAEGPEKGSKTFYTCYTHSEGGMGFAKQFLMTALGYPLTKDAEKSFNEKYRGSDWGLDTDSSSVGDMWREVTGKRVNAAVDVGLSDDGVTQQQKWIKFRPV